MRRLPQWGRRGLWLAFRGGRFEHLVGLVFLLSVSIILPIRGPL